MQQELFVPGLYKGLSLIQRKTFGLQPFPLKKLLSPLSSANAA